MSKKSIRFLDSLSVGTRQNYQSTIKDYETFHGTSIEELINEALTEQSERVPHHQLKVIDRIEDYQNYLISKDMVYGTISVMIGRIKTIYRKNRVELPYITPLNSKQIKRRDYIEYKDVLTKDELRCAMTHMKLPAQARLLTIAQGGLSNAECELLTTRAFIDETRKYHQCDDDMDALKWLAKTTNPIIWVTKLVRQKTKKPYYALIGSEAVNMIAKAKIYEYQLPKNNGKIPEKLLTMHKASFGRVCRNVSIKCGFPKVAEESKLRPHNLRRFNATYIRGSALTYDENSRISNNEIDEMQGRGKTGVQDTYIKSNPLEQKLIYAKVMNNVSLFNEYEYVLTDDDVEIFLVNQMEEKQKLEKKVKNLENQLAQKKLASEKVKKLREDLGNDVFDELVQGILNAS